VGRTKNGGEGVRHRVLKVGGERKPSEKKQQNRERKREMGVKGGRTREEENGADVWWKITRSVSPNKGGESFQNGPRAKLPAAR